MTRRHCPAVALCLTHQRVANRHLVRRGYMPRKVPTARTIVHQGHDGVCGVSPSSTVHPLSGCANPLTAARKQTTPKTHALLKCKPIQHTVTSASRTQLMSNTGAWRVEAKPDDSLWHVSLCLCQSLKSHHLPHPRCFCFLRFSFQFSLKSCLIGHEGLQFFNLFHRHTPFFFSQCRTFASVSLWMKCDLLPCMGPTRYVACV